ncbi:spore cortex biosynthesis protein YabQ [Peribacillus saganii]|uniref:Spore cortex biosynthesis protein YabQ n=1 Tax=Peribacillus saganii TaxID=2303992 RepID=A0A372LL37_9BACI|nr:spore cortex biosynthesis protein YabQ [Peribacillus saganii]RFU66910.1 spore cortex biosynthesis protein YabQ [Peribacillus saganii]
MTLTTQFYTLLAMIGMGSCFGAALDTYNRFLKRTKRNSLIVFVNDLLFWIVQALIIFYVLFLVNEGELRFYLFLALLCGFSAYQALLKSIYLKWLEAGIRSIIWTAMMISRMLKIMIFQPIKWLVSIVIFVVLSVAKGLFTLVRLGIKVVLSIMSFICKPFFWFINRFWEILPKSVTNRVEKIYNKCAGYSIRIKEYIINWKTNRSNKT